MQHFSQVYHTYKSVDQRKMLIKLPYWLVTGRQCIKIRNGNEPVVKMEPYTRRKTKRTCPNTITAEIALFRSQRVGLQKKKKKKKETFPLPTFFIFFFFLLHSSYQRYTRNVCLVAHATAHPTLMQMCFKVTLILLPVCTN